MGATKSRKSKSAKHSQTSPEKHIKIGGTPQKDLSKLYAQLALAPDSKKYLVQRIIDLIEGRNKKGPISEA